MPPASLQTLRWFLARPRLYPELVRRVGRRLTARPETRSPHERREATDWAAAAATDTATALALCTGVRGQPGFADLFPAEVAVGREAARQAPCPMGGPGDLDLLYHLAVHARARTAVETGVAYGWSSLALLLALEPWGGHLFSTDMPYVSQGTESFVGAVVPERLHPQWTLLRLPDRDGLPRVLGSAGPVDICHYDSDKTWTGRTWAYGQLFDALRPGGIFVSDDIGDNLAFHDFCEVRRLEPVIVRTRAFLGSEATGETWEKYVGVVVR